MKKEISQTVKRVRQSYGLEGSLGYNTNNLSEPTLDPETIRHQSFTDKIVRIADYSGLAVIASAIIGYSMYKIATTVPEIVDQASQFVTDISQYIQPFISS